MESKKGLSMVITTLIVILLVLVAVGIIWVVVRNVVQEGVGDIDYSTKCLSVDVKATTVDCTDPVACGVTLSRTAGGEEIAGIKLVFKNAAGNASNVIDVSGNIEPLGTVTKTVDSNITNPNKVEVTSYFKDASGSPKPCSQTDTFEFI